MTMQLSIALSQGIAARIPARIAGNRSKVARIPDTATQTGIVPSQHQKGEGMADNPGKTALNLRQADGLQAQGKQAPFQRRRSKGRSQNPLYIKTAISF